ncbi:hypothetical protein WBG83_21135 [Paenibacillus sp. y28]
MLFIPDCFLVLRPDHIHYDDHLREYRLVKRHGRRAQYCPVAYGGEGPELELQVKYLEAAARAFFFYEHEPS